MTVFLGNSARTHFAMRLASGMDIPIAQALGGWSTPAMLMNVYSHPVSENIWNAAGFMDKLPAQPSLNASELG